MSDVAAPRPVSPLWTWWVCGLLLCASTINYMDRQTLGNTSVRIKTEFGLNNQQYGMLENGFGWAFAAGALVFGTIADRTNIRWLYPAVLLAWSTMGFLTGWVTTFATLLLCRTLLGLFEAGHWPCALKTTQRLLPREKRALGNSVLQSGTAIGAVITPLILRAMLTEELSSWRPAFQAIAAVGAIWIVLWLLTVRGDELAPDRTALADGESAWDQFFALLWQRQFLVLIVVVVLINASYQLFRVWLQIVIQEGRGWTEAEYLRLSFWFYIFNDIGCLSAGFLTAWLPRRGWDVHRSRLVVFTGCALLCALSVLLPFIEQRTTLVVVLMLISMGLLGIFPCYYTFSQELTTRHQGKITGTLGCLAWLLTSPLQPLMGRYLDQTGQHDQALALVGLGPLVAAVMLWVFWSSAEEAQGSPSLG